MGQERLSDLIAKLSESELQVVIHTWAGPAPGGIQEGWELIEVR